MFRNLYSQAGLARSESLGDLTQLETDFQDRQEKTSKEVEFMMLEWGKERQAYQMYQFPVVRLFSPYPNISFDTDQQIVKPYDL